MKFTKRITSLLLIFVFAFTSICTVSLAADFSDVPEENVYYEAITALVDGGIVNGYEDGTFKPDNTITRAEFSKLLAVSSAPSGYVFSATTTAFPDIADMNASNGWAVPYIAYAVSTKAINGYPDGTFQAGNSVTYGEAIKMIVCTLGYGPVVDTSLVPWYQGYLNIANQIGLTKNAVSLGENPASRGIVAQLIYNMLDCPVLTQTGTDMNGNPIYSNSGSGSGSGTSFGESKDNATSDEGIVMGVTDYSLDGTAVGRNRVQIDDEVYVLSDNIDMDTVKSYIGRRVTYAYSGSGSKAEITKISRISGYNSELTIDPEQIDTLDERYIDYYATEDDEVRGKTTRISFSSPYVIYNGMPVNPSEIDGDFVLKYFNVETGSLKFLSNDGNDKDAELVTIENYVTYYANSPATSNGVTTIYDKNTTYTGIQSLAISEDDVESVTKVTSKGGKPASSALSAIANKSVVSVAVPYGAEDGKSAEGTTVIISSAYVSGTVNELSSDYENIVIGTASYELSPYFRTLMENGCPEATFTNGDNGKFYLDYLGRIVYVEKNETADPYGLLVAYAAGSGIDSDNALKIMTSSGKYLEYNMKSTLRVDGKSMASDEAIEYFKTTCKNYETFKATNENIIIQPVRYRTSGTTFTSIETMTPDIAKTSLYYAKSGYVFKESKEGSTKFTMTTSGTNATVAYVVPSDIEAYDKYKKSSATYFQDANTYAVEAYEVENSSAKVVVCYLVAGQSTGASIYAATPVYLVDSVNDARNDEGQTVKKLKYRNIASANEAKEILSSDNNEIIEKLSEVKSGDLIKFITEDGVISQIKTVYTNGALTTETGSAKSDNPNHIIRSYDGKDDYYQAVLGTVYTQDDDAKQISIIPELYTGTALDEGAMIPLSQSDSIQFYKYNATTSAFEASSSGAIKKYADFKDTDPTVASQAVAIVMNNKVVGVYLINVQ